ncbi:MAG: mandelate racemase/muconate lactonizing enzyme family protein [Candidatus Woesearchaeota archaeon]
MRITEITVIPKDFYLKEAFKFSSCILEKLPYALVQIKTDENITGYGECPAYGDPSGETQESAIGAINFVKSRIIGKSPFQIESIMRKCDESIYGAFSAKCGIDMALYDIVGKKLQVPVYELLGGNNYDVKVNGVVGMTSLENTIKKTDELVEEGYEYIKVKTGLDISDDEKRIARIREKYPSAKIFIDVNQGWGYCKKALENIRILEKYALSWIEQPINSKDTDGLKELKDKSGIAIMADESLYSYQDALRMAKDRTADMFNIKLAKSGGMFYGSRIKSIADAANIPCMLGSMIESSLGMLANYHFAKANEMLTCGLSAYTLIENDYDFGILIKKGILTVEKELPGLGYNDEEVLAKEFEVKEC